MPPTLTVTWSMQSYELKLVGIVEDAPGGTPRKRLVVKGPRADQYRTIEIPHHIPNKKGALKGQITAYFAPEDPEITFPGYMEVED
jgi:hypothetical protein